mmetsp:Transcript_81326/g.206582  ORF Transcript_81326/g.206582 Transcript_81326/m.206582 type:complete len:206 (+) Transcript_81326:748-1365(+)
MAIGQRLQHLLRRHDELRLAEAHPDVVRPKDVLPEFATGALFHDQIQVILTFERLVQPHNVGVVGRLEERDLGPHRIQIRHAALGDALDSYGLLRPLVLPCEDRPAAPFAQLPVHVVDVSHGSLTRVVPDEVGAAKASVPMLGQQLRLRAVPGVLVGRQQGRGPRGEGGRGCSDPTSHLGRGNGTVGDPRASAHGKHVCGGRPHE